MIVNFHLDFVSLMIVIILKWIPKFVYDFHDSRIDFIIVFRFSLFCFQCLYGYIDFHNFQDSHLSFLDFHDYH